MRLPWFALVAIVGISITVQALSGGPPARTVVEDDGCSCHSANPNPGTTVSVAYPANYLGAAKHSIRVTSTTDVVQNPAGNKGGFLAWVSHGTFSKPSTSADWYQTETLDGKSVIKHTLSGDQQNSAQEWRFDWTPPTTDVGVVTLKVWVNRVNGHSGADAGDHWNRKHVTMTAEPHQDPAPTSSPATTTSKAPTASSPTSTPRPPTTTAPATPTEPADEPALAAVTVLAVLGVLAAVYRRR